MRRIMRNKTLKGDELFDSLMKHDIAAQFARINDYLFSFKTPPSPRKPKKPASKEKSVYQ